MRDTIFVNRNLRMDCIHAIGFDMDYTLVRYRREPMEQLAYRLALEKLHQQGYPEKILACRYDPRFVIRGLVVDRTLGNIIKLDRHNHPCRVLHGRTPLDRDARRATYRREHLAFVAPRFMSVDTLFSMPEVCLYADLVDFFDARASVGSPTDYGKLFDDIRQVIDEMHRDQSLKSEICQNLRDYIDIDPHLAPTLRKLRSSGKRLFIVTNSQWDYTDQVMRHILDEVLPDYPHWTDYFDAVVTHARKPQFFSTQAPLLSLDGHGQPLGVPAGVVVHNHAARRPRRLRHNFEGGHQAALEEVLGVRGEDVLYVGDHIFGDILRSKKASLWRTCLVVEELDDELSVLAAHTAQRAHIDELELSRDALSHQVNLHRQQLTLQGRLVTLAQNAEREADKEALRRLDTQIAALYVRIGQGFNALWGMTFKEGHENSRFGDQVAHYACLYTSRVSHLRNYSSYQYFRSPKDVMPHERMGELSV